MRKKTIAAAVWLCVPVMLCVPAFALEESEVQTAIAASSKESVAGNLFIWFLCAIAFLKIGQKIDSFMAGLGINVGRTGGSMISELLIAVRAVTSSMFLSSRFPLAMSRSAFFSAVLKSFSPSYILTPIYIIHYPVKKLYPLADIRQRVQVLKNVT